MVVALPLQPCVHAARAIHRRRRQPRAAPVQLARASCVQPALAAPGMAHRPWHAHARVAHTAQPGPLLVAALHALLGVRVQAGRILPRRAPVLPGTSPTPRRRLGARGWAAPALRARRDTAAPGRRPSASRVAAALAITATPPHRLCAPVRVARAPHAPATPVIYRRRTQPRAAPV